MQFVPSPQFENMEEVIWLQNEAKEISVGGVTGVTYNNRIFGHGINYSAPAIFGGKCMDVHQIILLTFLYV